MIDVNSEVNSNRIIENHLKRTLFRTQGQEDPDNMTDLILTLSFAFVTIKGRKGTLHETFKNEAMKHQIGRMTKLTIPVTEE